MRDRQVFLSRRLQNSPCSVSVDKDGNAVDGKRLLALMGLGIKQGQEITLRCEGEQEAEAMEALSDFLQKNL